VAKLVVQKVAKTPCVYIDGQIPYGQALAGPDDWLANAIAEANGAAPSPFTLHALPAGCWVATWRGVPVDRSRPFRKFHARGSRRIPYSETIGLLLDGRRHARRTTARPRWPKPSRGGRVVLFVLLSGMARRAGDLTPRQERFCEEFVLDWNAGAAYRRAGYQASTDNAAWNGGSRMLRVAKVLARIAALRNAVAQRAEVKAQDVIAELQIICMTDFVGQIVQVNPDGTETYKPILDWPEHVRRQVAGIKLKRKVERQPDGSFAPFEILDVRWINKTGPLHDLATHLGVLQPVAGGDALGAVPFDLVVSLVQQVERERRERERIAVGPVEPPPEPAEPDPGPASGNGQANPGNHQMP
jgi:phage terminase small subunit